MTNVEDNFRDEAFPDRKRISSELSMEGGEFGSIHCPPDAFYDYKSTGMLCNDKPPNLYLACILWQKVFHDRLNQEDKETWQRGNPAKIMEIDIDVGTLQETFNRNYVPGGSVKKDEIVECLNFLIVAGVADRTGKNSYRVNYRNLSEKRTEFSDRVSPRSQIADLARLFAKWHCENSTELDTAEMDDLLEPSESEPEEDEEIDMTAGQSGLDEFF